jgi:hypothetical protein
MSAPPVTAALKALAQQRLSEATDRANLRSLGGGCFVDVAFAQSLRRFKQIIDLDLSGMGLFFLAFRVASVLSAFFFFPDASFQRSLKASPPHGRHNLQEISSMTLL